MAHVATCHITQSILSVTLLLQVFALLKPCSVYATNTTKTTKKSISTKNIFMMSHLLDDMLLRYFSS